MFGKRYFTGKTLSTVQDACDELKEYITTDFNTSKIESTKRLNWVNKIAEESSINHPGVVGMKMNSELIKKLIQSRYDRKKGFIEICKRKAYYQYT